jgi:hypothetical protein
LKNWITQQSEREGEASQQKKRKIEERSRCFDDENYNKERALMTERVSDAVEQGTSLHIEIDT